MSKAELDSVLEKLPLDSVWHVGHRLAPKLERIGIGNVLKLKNTDPRYLKDKFSILIERTIRELNGEPLMELEELLPEAKQVMSSRSFGHRLHLLEDLEPAIAFHARTACERMRSRGMYANAVYVFIQNSPHDQAQFRCPQGMIGFQSTTSDTLEVTEAALSVLRKVYEPGVYYLKGGVMLMELVDKPGRQAGLLSCPQRESKTLELMGMLDKANKKYGRGTIRTAAEGTDKAWVMRRELKSPNYTGDWNEIRRVR